MTDNVKPDHENRHHMESPYTDPGRGWVNRTRIRMRIESMTAYKLPGGRHRKES